MKKAMKASPMKAKAMKAMKAMKAGQTEILDIEFVCGSMLSRPHLEKCRAVVLPFQC